MGKSNSADGAANQAAQAQAQLAQQLVGQTDPLRRQLINQASQFAGGRDVTNLPEFGALKSVAEAQFQNARDSAIANTPEGGALSSALTDLEIGRARSLAEGAGQISSNEVDRGLQLATFGAAQGSAGLGGAANIQAQRAAAQSAENAGKSSGLGQAAGTAAGLKLASDRRLKKNIEKIGMMGPYPLYSYDYISGGHSVGVMADEVPEKYRAMVDGFYHVNYGALVGG